VEKRIRVLLDIYKVEPDEEYEIPGTTVTRVIGFKK